VAGEAFNAGEKLWKSGAGAGGKETQYLVVPDAAGRVGRSPENRLDAAGYLLNKYMIYKDKHRQITADKILDTPGQHA
jgi:hypothetical protein